MARPGNVWDRNSHRVDRRAGLLAMAVTARGTCQSGLASAPESFMYACKIEKAANGSRRCARGQSVANAPSQRLKALRGACTSQGAKRSSAKSPRRSAKGNRQRRSGAKVSKKVGEQEETYPFSLCITSITCFKGSVLILVAPVKGWSRT